MTFCFSRFSISCCRPMSETIALGQRDFEYATAQSLANLSLIQQQPISSHFSKSRIHSIPPEPGGSIPGRRVMGGMDEISRAQATARMRAFMDYKGNLDGYSGDEDDDDFLLDRNEDGDGHGVDEPWAAGEGEGEYDGDEDRIDLKARGGDGVEVEQGTGQRVDEQGEDEDGWMEGNDEYYDGARRIGRG